MLFTHLIIIITALASWYGFKNRYFYQKSIFNTGDIIENHQIHRMISSLFIHVDWAHLLFNLFSLYSFSRVIERGLGPMVTAAVYFGSGIFGNLLSLALNRKKPLYSAAGASGAVCGIIYASIFLMPGGSIIVFPVPIPIPAWLFGIIFILASIYGIDRNSDNIGHDAHLGGALAGTAIAVGILPGILREEILLLAGMTLPVIIFLIIHRRRIV